MRDLAREREGGEKEREGRKERKELVKGLGLKSVYGERKGRRHREKREASREEACC